jgi:hypothetical protein
LVKGKWAIAIGVKPCYDGRGKRKALIERDVDVVISKGFSIGA